jgi:hypothetical protein
MPSRALWGHILLMLISSLHVLSVIIRGHINVSKQFSEILYLEKHNLFVLAPHGHLIIVFV